MAEKLTTIPIAPRVRDRLKTYGSMGETYSAILERMMDQIERDEFLAQLRREVDDPATDWVDLEELGWDG